MPFFTTNLLPSSYFLDFFYTTKFFAGEGFTNETQKKEYFLKLSCILLFIYYFSLVLGLCAEFG